MVCESTIPLCLYIKAQTTKASNYRWIKSSTKYVITEVSVPFFLKVAQHLLPGSPCTCSSSSSPSLMFHPSIFECPQVAFPHRVSILSLLGDTPPLQKQPNHSHLPLSSPTPSTLPHNCFRKRFTPVSASRHALFQNSKNELSPRFTGFMF